MSLQNRGSVCASVRESLDAVRDGRATPAEATFFHAHVAHCAECASEWAFAKATKAAWTRTPNAVPPASLSARIAAATYRKPTFAERCLAAFAFLLPVPVRVGVGVAAVAGIAYFAVPRPVPVAVITPTPAPVVARVEPKIAPLVPKAIAEKQVAQVAPKPVAPKPVVAKMVAPVVAAPKTVVAVKPVAPAPVTRPVVAIAPAPRKPVQVAIAPVPKHRVSRAHPVEAEMNGEASLHEPAPQIAPAENPVAVVTHNPVEKEPVATPPQTVAGMTVGEREEGNGYRNLGGDLSNVGRRSEALRGGAMAFVANNATTALVSMPVKNR